MRVRILYQSGDYFVCRHCLNLSYSARQRRLSRRPDLRFIELMIKAEDEMANFPKFRRFYNGQPTKKYIKWQKMIEKSNRLFNSIDLSFLKKQ